MELALEYKVILTESMVEGMTMEKKSGQNEKEHNAQRQELLLKIASTCKKQNSFHLAAKKYTQAGEKLKAMKSLLMSGDTERIIFFANVARQKEVYILAANYLSNLENVHENEQTVKVCIQHCASQYYGELSCPSPFVAWKLIHTGTPFGNRRLSIVTVKHGLSANWDHFLIPWR